MAEKDKIQREEMPRDKVVHQERVKLVVRSGSSVSISDLQRVSFDLADSIIVLVDEADVFEPNKADGRIIKTLLAIFNHPDVSGPYAAKLNKIKVAAEVMVAANQEIAQIAAGGRAQVIK